MADLPARPASRALVLVCLLPCILAILVAAKSAGNGEAVDSDKRDVEHHWAFPLPENTEFSSTHLRARGSLEPAACGQCHVEQYRMWRQSRHAGAFGAGVLGQALEMEPFEVRGCMNCHAPLTEQFMGFEKAMEVGARDFDKELASAGIVCAACHMRRNQVYGPPRRQGGASPSDVAAAPHGTVARVGWFERSLFCAACHQGAQSDGPNGKPLMNTFVEWQSSEFAKMGVGCQQCHMPDRAHAWRGIHDPAMVASGLSAEYRTAQDRVEFEVTNAGVGHAFPTYVTPRALMMAVAIDDSGVPIAGTEKTLRIARDVFQGRSGWEEISDTRLLPGTSATLQMAWGPWKWVKVWLEVQPDHFYEATSYPQMITTLRDGSRARAHLEAALAAAKLSSYRLFERILTRPPPE